MFGLEKLFGHKTDFKKMREEGAIILDVRSPQEFESGHIPGAINIPVENIGGAIPGLKKENKAIITCCRSGMRSNMAANLLRNAGLNAVNGGPWISLSQIIK